MAKMHEGPIVLRQDELKAIDCRWCGYAHLDPLPRQSDLDAYWDDLYAGGFLYEQESTQRWYWDRVYRERMRRFNDLVGLSVPLHWSWRLLDYGAGLGNFIVAVHRQYGWWSVYGYERNGSAKSHSVSPYQYVFGLPYTHYDAVHCSLVLEHVLDPLGVLRHIHDALIPGGILCIIVPNEFNPLQKRLRRFGYSPLYPHHVNYFTQGTLAALVKDAGFDIVETTATFPIEAFALAGLNYVKHPRLGSIAHWLRTVFEVMLLAAAPRMKRKLYSQFAKWRIGREIELWARKKS